MAQPVSLEKQALAALSGYDPDPEKWGELYAVASRKWGVPAKLLEAVVHQESSGNVLARSRAGAEGSTQLMPDTSAAGRVSPWDPTQAIPYAAELLRRGYDKGGKSWDYALKSYFGGPDESEWGPKTAQYPSDVLKTFLSRGGKAEDLVLPGVSTLVPAPAPAPALAPPQVEPPSAPMAAGKGLEDQARSLLGEPPEFTPAPVPVTSGNGQVPSPASPPAPAPSLLQQAGSTVTGLAKDAVNSTPLGPDWNLAKTALNGFTLGYLPEISALGSGASAGVSALLGGSSAPLEQAQQAYATKLAAQLAAKDQYKLANPYSALAGELGGNLAGLSLGTGLLGAGLRGVNAGVRGLGLTKTAGALDTAGDVIGGTFGVGEGGPIGWVKNLLGKAVSGGVQGAGAGLADSHLGDAPVGDQVALGSKIGMIASPLLGAAAIPLEHLLNPRMAPALAKMLGGPEAEAVGLRPGQVGQGSGVKTLDNMVGSGGNDAQVKAFNSKFAQLTGMPGEELTPDGIIAGLRANGTRMEAVAHKVGDLDVSLPTNGAPHLFDALDTLRIRIRQSPYVSQPEFKPILNLMDRLETDALTGISGKEYQELTQFKGPLWQMQQDKFAPAQDFAQEVRKILDGTLESTAVVKGSPELVGELKDARNSYKALKAVQGIPASTGNQSGTLSPPDVAKAIAKAYDNPAAAGELGRLAQVGKYLSRVSPQGDTEKAFTKPDFRMITHYLPSLLGGVVGGGAGVHGGLGPMGSALLGLTAAGAGHGVGNMMAGGLASPIYRRAAAMGNLGGPPAFAVPTNALATRPLNYLYQDSSNPQRAPE